MKNFGSVVIPLAFILLFGYSLYLGEWVDAVMYLFVGSGFTLINLIKAEKITHNLTFWNRLSWALVLLSALMFVAVLLNDANKEILTP
ncbi:hypothetical protein MNBD_BACTEROID06-532 [hydrothermal vent metagenome]|uniref:Uncharacterized protein n=1 Tax=hydrothermal vent metagenome TaxID=652676 RepID=A0A3B0V4Y5_9ZZZZ